MTKRKPKPKPKKALPYEDEPAAGPEDFGGSDFPDFSAPEQTPLVQTPAGIVQPVLRVDARFLMTVQPDDQYWTTGVVKDSGFVHGAIVRLKPPPGWNGEVAAAMADFKSHSPAAIRFVPADSATTHPTAPAGAPAAPRQSHRDVVLDMVANGGYLSGAELQALVEDVMSEEGM